MYPLKFKPLLFDKIWGGEKLKYIYPETSLQNIGESWLVSAVQDKESVVINGFLAENTLSELVEVYLTELVGERVYKKFGEEFPLLVKLIDSRQDLSIQVHPNDDIAGKRHNSFGKNEFWYMLDCAPDAFIIAGFNKKLTKQEFLDAAKNGNVENHLRKIHVKKGDFIFIPAGCVHTIGRGCTLIEIQQSSDITYRIYDYNRKDEHGNPRQLHLKQALDAINFENYNFSVNNKGESPNNIVNLIDNESFAINQIELTQSKELRLAEIDSFVLLSVVEGDLTCIFGQEKLDVNYGETILIPAEMSDVVLVPKQYAKILETFIKIDNFDEHQQQY
ncbi:MAG: class I mannose-6-phosphate isomerase [Prevotellaceae bacterium]|jgi:mannose-6-phosphate isomerase|nr:class I mannose-6-phosphate isomerase [Prevotellaceae bacterium]